MKIKLLKLIISLFFLIIFLLTFLVLFDLAKYDASYIKLRTVRIDYDLPANVLEKTPFKKLNIGMFANNVWLIHSAIPGLDPSEIETRNGVNWTEGGQLPNVRTVGFNIRMTF